MSQRGCRLFDYKDIYSCLLYTSASIMGAYAVDIMLEGKTNRVVGYQHGEFIDFDIEDALQMEKGINDYQFEVSHLLSI